MAAPNAYARPDFDVLDRATRDIGAELGKLANLPTVDEGRRLLQGIEQLTHIVTGLSNRVDAVVGRLDALSVNVDQRFEAVDQRFEALNQKIDQRFEAVDQRFEALNQKIDQMDQKINQKIDQMDQRNCRMLKALDHNNHARTWNAMVRLPETALAPLRNLSTNEPIPGFPQKPDRIGSMSNAAIDLVMRALELSTDHPVAVKRRLLKSYIGLFDPSVPVPSIE